MLFKSTYTLASLTVLLMSSFLVEPLLCWAQVDGDDDIEMLEIIEVPGTAVIREPRTVSFQSPNVKSFLPLTAQDLFGIPTEFTIERPYAPPMVLLAPQGKAQGIQTSVKALKAERPTYPRFAREQGWHGTTVLRIRVGPTGQVTSVSTQKSSGYPILDESANQAVKQWKFLPAKNGEFEVASIVDLPIRFDLDQPD